jgi:ATP-dependent Clp protease ATP-binding subunit ClpA
VVRLVADKFLRELALQIQDRNVAIEATEAAREWLTEKGYRPEFGAREMGRLIHQQVKRKLADLMLFGELLLGGTAIVDVESDGLTVRVKKDAPVKDLADA